MLGASLLFYVPDYASPTLQVAKFPGGEGERRDRDVALPLYTDFSEPMES